MKIKKIPFPPVEDVLCMRTPGRLTVSVHDHEWEIEAYEDNYHTVYEMKWFVHDSYFYESNNRVGIYYLEEPGNANPKIREWYKNATEEMQTLFEEHIKLWYGED